MLKELTEKKQFQIDSINKSYEVFNDVIETSKSYLQTDYVYDESSNTFIFTLDDTSYQIYSSDVTSSSNEVVVVINYPQDNAEIRISCEGRVQETYNNITDSKVRIEIMQYVGNLIDNIPVIKNRSLDLS